MVHRLVRLVMGLAGIVMGLARFVGFAVMVRSRTCVVVMRRRRFGVMVMMVVMASGEHQRRDHRKRRHGYAPQTRKTAFHYDLLLGLPMMDGNPQLGNYSRY